MCEKSHCVVCWSINQNTKIADIENKIDNHNQGKYIDTSEFNKLASDGFNARLAQANLITKTSLMLNYRVLIEKLLKINQNIYLLKMN